MVVSGWVGDRKAHRDYIEERRVWQHDATCPEVVAHVEADLVAARMQVVTGQQSAVQAPVGIGTCVPQHGHHVADDAAQLQIAAGTPLLSVERVSHTFGDKPVELRRGLYVTTRHYYQNELN